MHTPRHFDEPSLIARHDLIRAWPLATVVTQSAQGLNANHIPFVLHPEQGELGALHGHVPRANPMVQDLQARSEILAIFSGPNGYISPSWYATKPKTGRVVPTWNYSVVHAYGEAEIIADEDWLHRQLDALTREQESQFEQPWQVEDAPEDFTERLVNSLVGIKISITRLQGKTKASQNQPPENRQTVIAGLRSLGNSTADALADSVEKAER